MPRGWLKHKKEAGYKKSRGGGGHKSYPSEKEGRQRYPRNWPDKLDAEIEYGFREYANEAEYDSSGNDDSEKPMVEERKGPVIAQCPICFETRPVIKLLQKCKHAPACYDCLRRILVTEAQGDVTNFPLHCFDPTCRRPVTDHQLRIHNLVQTDEELAKHYRLTVLAKGYRNKSVTVHCPHCDHPRSYHQSPRVEQERIFGCKNCGMNFTAYASGLSRTIKAVEEFKPDSKGGNDGWGRCPSCRIIISKGDGCNHIACVCGQHFYWWDALREESAPRYAVARPAED